MSQNARILVVDDEPQWLRSLSHILGGAGYVVRQAASGEDTLASLAGGAPDLILLDIRMRGMDGFEVFRKIREHEEWSSIPVIMVSGLVEAKERAALKNQNQRRMYDVRLRMMMRCGQKPQDPGAEYVRVESTPFSYGWCPTRPNAEQTAPN